MSRCVLCPRTNSFVCDSSDHCGECEQWAEVEPLEKCDWDGESYE